MLQPRLFILLSVAVLVVACKKSTSPTDPVTPPANAYKLSYGDSILYLKSGSSDHIVQPAQPRNGVYTAYPEGIEINSATGAINVSKSETGLRYRVKFKDVSGETAETTVLLSGVNYADYYHKMTTADSISFASYNGGKPMPQASFDIDNSARRNGLAIDPVTGAINLKQSIRNGVFGSNLQNDVRKELEIKYRINDASNNAVNTIKVLLYWYNTMNDVPSDLKQLIIDRQPMFLRGTSPYGTNGTRAAAKPRPPCVIVIAQ